MKTGLFTYADMDHGKQVGMSRTGIRKLTRMVPSEARQGIFSRPRTDATAHLQRAEWSSQVSTEWLSSLTIGCAILKMVSLNSSSIRLRQSAGHNQIGQGSST